MMHLGLFWIGWLFVSWQALHILPVTRLVFDPRSMTLIDGEVQLYRVFPGDALGLPRPSLSYVETLRPLTPDHNDGQSCQTEGGPFRYNRATTVGTWSIDEWAARCLSDPVGVEWTARWTWHLGGVELGPVSMTQAILWAAPPAISID